MKVLKITSLLISIIFLSTVALAQEVHPDVQTALGWQPPENKCEFKLKRSNVASGTERKYKKAVKRYKKCVATYLTGLALAQKRMMAVAQHGLTQEQADIIMGNMRNIQSLIQATRPPPSAPPADVPLDTRELQQTRHH